MVVMCRLWLLCVGLCALVSGAWAVVGGSPAVPPEPDAAVVFVQRHGRSARLQGLKDDRLGYYSFFGIRYAEPPLGQRRFQRPVRRLLAGELPAERQCMPCPQPDPYVPNRIMGHEDCLCLNVYAPKMPGEEEGCPVVFFIHGGNYKSGSASAYGGQHLTQKDTILVTAQYRLGSLGYLSTGQRDAAGNLGLFDLRAAMKWVQDYIEFFGGDPKRVVVMGQGSGGSAASLLALSSEERTATGVAALSGSPLSPGAIRSDPGKHANSLADRTGCPQKPAERLLKCLRMLPMEKIVEADKNITMDMVDTQRFLEEISGRSGAGARVEGDDDRRALPPVISEQPATTLSRKEKRAPFLTGVNSAETSRAVHGKYAKFLTDQLKAVQDFIKNDVVGGLRNVVQGVDGLLPGNLKGALPLVDYYQALFDNSLRAVDGLSEIAEATGDALFNFPAFQSVRTWSSGGPAYLYSFEHVGNLTKGSHFLPGVALAEESAATENPQQNKMKGPSHGDELAYIFEPLDAEGKSMGGEVSSTDARARDTFVGLISKFAHDLNKEDKKTKNTTGLMGLSPFSKGDENDQFFKITDKISVEKNFRFCQMGIWGNMAERLTGALCKNLISDLLNLSNLPVALPLPTGNSNGPLPNLGILGQKTEPPKRVEQIRRPTGGGGGVGGGLLNNPFG